MVCNTVPTIETVLLVRVLKCPTHSLHVLHCTLLWHATGAPGHAGERG